MDLLYQSTTKLIFFFRLRLVHLAVCGQDIRCPFKTQASSSCNSDTFKNRETLDRTPPCCTEAGEPTGTFTRRSRPPCDQQSICPSVKVSFKLGRFHFEPRLNKKKRPVMISVNNPPRNNQTVALTNGPFITSERNCLRRRMLQI